jgi:hypothetical protein
MSGRRILSCLSRAAERCCADAESRGPVFEPLEPRQLLDGTGLLEARSLVASIPPVDPTIFSDMAQAAPVIEPAAAASVFPLDQTFLLHSDPGALRVIYLDFDGHTTTGTLWNSGYTHGADIVTPAYSFEGDSSFSDNELARIQYIWQRVAEDYIPFDVDVTTQDPGSAALIKSGGSDSQYGVRVCIGGDSTWLGEAAGGVAYVGSFNWNSDTPCFVFPAELGNGNEKDTAEAISHEAGHTLGLNHDGTSKVEYYEGQGTGPTGWAPIEGVGYYKELTQWSKGEYLDANNHEDDLAILAGAIGGFGYRVDDHGGTIATAAGLGVVGITSVSGEGIIERTADLDFFSFTTGQGLVSLSINPAPRGPNLDILATLYDSSGVVVAASNPIGALNASFSLSLLAGTYYLSIDGTGEGDPLVTGYSDYGSLGYYSITGVIVAPVPVVTIVASDASAAERGLDPGIFTVSRTGDTGSALEVFYTVSGSAGNGVDYQQIPLSVTIPADSASAQITITPIDDSLREGDETVVLTLQSGAGFLVGEPGLATITIADDDLVFSTNDFAVSEATTYGSIVSSSLLDTLASDNVYEQLKEVVSSGNPRGYSRLEHKWTFNVAAGGRVMFFVEAYHTANTEGDDFRFAYSTDGTTWTTLLTVTKTADDNVAQQAALPDGLSGTVYIRVKDTDRTARHKVLDSLYIDKMFIRSDPSIAGDANVDGVVDASDYIALKMAFGMAGGAAWNDGDFDQDGDVDYADLSVLMSNFSWRSFTLAPAAAPIASEPAPIAAATVAVATDPAKTAEIIPSPDTTVAPAAPDQAPAAAVSAFPLAKTFQLHSDPGALRVIYLDFDGHTTTGTSWNTGYNGGAAIVTPAYSFEGDSSFSDNELARIQYIWQRVAEDFIPFDVDVTTQDPGLAAIIGRGDSRYGQRVVIGGDSSWYGPVIGGVAYIGSFGSTSDTPCFAFSDNLGISNHGNEKYVAEAISHEVGHTLNLRYHDGAPGITYYQGQGDGATGWAPLMGIGYYKELTQWSKGEYTGANNHKDELSILAGATGGFGYRLDDHGGTIATAVGLTVVGGTSVSGQGIIERTADLDFFSFTTGQGLVSLSIDPAPRGPNLDILATLYDILGEVVAVSNPIGALNASFSLSLPAGTYYLSIDGTGEGDPLVTGYSDYGSLGYYSITGAIVPEPATMSLLALLALSLPKRGGLSLLKRRRAL